MLSGKQLEPPRLRAERKIAELLPIAAGALRRILEMDMRDLEANAQSAGLRVQLEAATHVIDGCLGMAAAAGDKQTRNAAKILAAVGGDAVTRELQRRYAQKRAERQRIVEAVPAVSDEPASESDAADSGSDNAVQPTAAEADGGSASDDTRSDERS